MIAPEDRGFTLGDGLFETLLALDGRVQRAPAHLERMARGCAVLGLPSPDVGAAFRLMETALNAAGLRQGRAAVRLSFSAGAGGRGLDRPDRLEPRMTAAAAPAPQPAGPARLITAQVRRNEGSPASGLKTLAYLDNVLARAEARRDGADEALMLNNRGEVACATAANLFWLSAGQAFTPALACGVLPGLTRGRILAEAARRGRPVAEVRVERAALQAAEALAITNTLIGVRAVASLDDRTLPNAVFASDLEALAA